MKDQLLYPERQQKQKAPLEKIEKWLNTFIEREKVVNIQNNEPQS